MLGTIVSQTLLNLLALAILGGVTLSSVSVLDGHDRALLLVALAPLAALLASLLAPVLLARRRVSRSRRLQCAARGGAALAAAPARRPARVRQAAPRERSPRSRSSARGRFSGCPAGCC